MKWHTATFDGYITRYVWRDYEIRHYMAGFQISKAEAYLGDRLLGTYEGSRALEVAMRLCERNAEPVAELDLPRGEATCAR